MATTAKLWIKVTAKVGTPTFKVWHTHGASNWGATLVAADADFTSTNENSEEEKDITATGWVSFDVDFSHLDASETNYFRITETGYGAQDNENATFASQNNATAGDRPYLELTVTAAGKKMFGTTVVELHGTTPAKIFGS